MLSHRFIRSVLVRAGTANLKETVEPVDPMEIVPYYDDNPSLHKHPDCYVRTRPHLPRGVWTAAQGTVTVRGGPWADPTASATGVADPGRPFLRSSPSRGPVVTDCSRLVSKAVRWSTSRRRSKSRCSGTLHRLVKAVARTHAC